VINPSISSIASRLGATALAAFTLAAGCTSPGVKSAGGVAGAAAGTTTASTATPAPLPANCTPLETRAPNATGQTPAFPGQTRICGV
jgi:hypothetical protein